MNLSFLANEDKIEIRSSVFFPVSHEDIDIVFNHIFNREKFYKWFNCMPAVWIRFDRKQMEVGCTGIIYFTMPIFYYKLKVVKVKPNKSIVLIGSGGPMRGKAYFNFDVTENGVLLENIHILSGKNCILHKYYVYCLVPNHLRFMNWRYSILKKQIYKELKSNHKVHN